MALDRTSGFDMLVQLSEDELNDQIATAFLAGNLFPTSMNTPININGALGTVFLNFTTPTADLDRPSPRIGLTIPFINSQLQITTPAATTIAPLGGTITIVDDIEIIAQGTDQIAVMDFNNGAPNVTVAFDAASQTLLAPLLTIAGLTLAQAQTIMAASVVQQLQSGLGRMNFTPPIPVSDDSNPTTIFDIDVTTVNDATALDRDCLTFGIRMSSDAGGNINGVTNSFLQGDSPSLIMMSNYWLLADVMRQRIADSLGRPITDFDTPLRLNRTIPAPGGDGNLTMLVAYIEEDRIRVDGRATDSGSGWSAVSDFTFFIEIRLSGGSLTITATTPSVNTDVDLELWVWLLSLGLGAFFGGIIGAIVALILVAVAEAIASAFADGIVGGDLNDSLGDMPSIPLGPIGTGLALSDVVLDDLELRCSIIKSLSVPIKAQGDRKSLHGFSIDLDNGTISSDVLYNTDLTWDPLSSGFSTNNPAGLTITGGSFHSLTPVKLSSLALSGQNIPIALVPLTYSTSFPFLNINDVVFGVRTTDGRMAKVKAWRSMTEGGRLHMRWVTYDTPIPRLDISARWSIIERGVNDSISHLNSKICPQIPVKTRGYFEAWPRLVPFPVTYEWCLCGQVLEEGEGEISSPDGPLSYKLKGRYLTIETEMAQTVYCELCVSAIDARDHELFTCIKLSQTGTGFDTECTRDFGGILKNIDLDFIPIKPEINGWRPLIDPRQFKEKVNIK